MQQVASPKPGKEVDKDLQAGQRLVYSSIPPGLHAADLSKIQGLLDGALTRPIRAIEAIVREELAREEWDATVDGIRFEALKDLACAVVARKDSGENASEFERMRNEIESLKQRLGETENELRETRDALQSSCERERQQNLELEKLRGDMRAINGMCIEIGSNSMSKGVRDQADVLKGENLDDEAQYITMFFKTLDADLAAHAKKMNSLELTNKELADENERLKRELDGSKAVDETKKRMETLLRDLQFTVSNLPAIRSDDLVEACERTMAFESRIRALKEMTTTMNDKLMTMSLELETTTAALATCRNELNQVREQLDATAENLNMSTDILDKFQKKIGEMESQMNITDVEDDEKEHLYLRSRLRRIIEEVNWLREDYKSQKEELNDKVRKLRLARKRRLEVEGRFKKIEAYVTSIQNVLQVVSSRSDFADDHELVEMNTLIKRMADLVAVQAMMPEEEDESDFDIDDDLEFRISYSASHSQATGDDRRSSKSLIDDQEQTEASLVVQSPAKSTSEDCDAMVQSMRNEIAILNRKISELEEVALDVLDDDGNPITVPAKAIAGGLKNSEAFAAMKKELERCRNVFGYRKLEDAVAELERQLLKRTQSDILDLDKRVAMLTRLVRARKVGRAVNLPGQDPSVEVMTGQFVSDLAGLEEEVKRLAETNTGLADVTSRLEELRESLSKHLVISPALESSAPATPIKRTSPESRPLVSPLRLLDSPRSQKANSLESVLDTLEGMTETRSADATPTKRVEGIIDKLENKASQHAMTKLKTTLGVLQSSDESKHPEIAKHLMDVCTELEEAQIVQVLTLQEDTMTPLLEQVSHAFSVIYGTLATMFRQPVRDAFVVTDSRSLCAVANAFAELFIMIERYHASVEQVIHKHTMGTYAEELAVKVDELKKELAIQRDENAKLQEESARKGQTFATLTQRMKKYQDGEKEAIRILKPLIPNPSPSLLNVDDIAQAVATLFDQITATLARATGRSGTILELLKAVETK